MSEAIKFTITKARREVIDSLIRKAIKEKFGKVVAVEAALDRRYSNREGDAAKKIAAWSGYERYVLENGHTVYVGLTNPSDPQVSISEGPRAAVLNKVRAKAKKAEERATHKTTREAKKAEPKTAKVKVVRYDPKVPVVPAGERMVKGCTRP